MATECSLLSSHDVWVSLCLVVEEERRDNTSKVGLPSAWVICESGRVSKIRMILHPDAVPIRVLQCKQD